MDRAHRLGQTRQVTVYRLITKGTIDERIVQLARVKKDVNSSIWHAVSLLIAVGDRCKTLSSATRRSPTSRNPAKLCSCFLRMISLPTSRLLNRPPRVRERSAPTPFKRTQAEISGMRREMTSLARTMLDRLVIQRTMKNLGPLSQRPDVAESAVVALVHLVVVGRALAAAEEARRRYLWATGIHNLWQSFSNDLHSFSCCCVWLFVLLTAVLNS